MAAAQRLACSLRSLRRRRCRASATHRHSHSLRIRLCASLRGAGCAARAALPRPLAPRLPLRRCRVLAARSVCAPPARTIGLLRRRCGSFAAAPSQPTRAAMQARYSACAAPACGSWRRRAGGLRRARGHGALCAPLCPLCAVPLRAAAPSPPSWGGRGFFCSAAVAAAPASAGRCRPRCRRFGGIQGRGAQSRPRLWARLGLSPARATPRRPRRRKRRLWVRGGGRFFTRFPLRRGLGLRRCGGAASRRGARLCL